MPNAREPTEDDCTPLEGQAFAMDEQPAPDCKHLDVSEVGTVPETEPERTIAHAERLSVLLGLPAPEGRWRYLRDV